MVSGKANSSSRGRDPDGRKRAKPPLGEAELRDQRLVAGESFRITPGTVHYMEAVSDCDILEASTPELDDVVRLQDRYGRQGTSAP